MANSIDCEVVVVGAGPVGLLTTLLLAKAGINVILIEALSDIDDSPRAMAYGAPAVVELERAGIAADARKFGMEPSDYDFRLRWITIENKVIAEFKPEDKIPGSFDAVICGQYRLAKIIQRHLGDYSCAKVLFNHNLSNITENEDSITASTETPEGVKKITAKYLVGADGGRSAVRKILGYEGFTLPQWLVACNVRYPFRDYGFQRAQFIVHPQHFCTVGKIDPTGLYRVSYNEQEHLSKEEVLANVHKKFEAISPGPKPLLKDAYQIEMINPYRIYQRSATSYRKGRAFLAGDAAMHVLHLATFTGMGLTGGICDAGGLADCLIGVLRKGCDDSLLDKYAEIRRQKYHEITNPVSYGNTCALRDTDAETAETASEPFKTMNASPEARRKMLERAYLLGHDFRQYWPSSGTTSKDEKHAALFMAAGIAGPNAML